MTAKSLHVLFIHPHIRAQEGPQHPPYGMIELATITDQHGYRVGFIDNNAFQLPIDALRQEIKGNPQPKTVRIQNVDVTLNPNGTFVTNTKNYCRREDHPEEFNGCFINEEFCKKLALESKRLSLHEMEWDIIAIGGLITQTKNIIPIAKMCREEFPRATLVAGGGFLSSMPFEMMKWIPEFDIGVIGEAYRTWPEVLTEVQSGPKDWKRIKGLIYRDGSKLKLSGMRPLLTEEEMDNEIPWPNYQIPPIERYLQCSPLAAYSPETTGLMTFNVGESLRRLDMRSSLGCSWNCSFCHHVCGSPSQQSELYGKKVQGKAFRHHSTKYVVGLMSDLRSRYGINFFSFIDENFTTDRQWFLDFCDELGEQDLVGLVNWGVVGHSRTVDQEMLIKGRDAGMRYISYGGESGSQKILDSIGKGQTPAQMAAAIEATQAAQIVPIMSFIVGFPEETIDDIIQTCEFLIENGIHCEPFFLQPYPATKYYREYKEAIIKQYLLPAEKRFLEKPTPENYMHLIDALGTTTPSAAAIFKNLDKIKAGLRDTALQRWVLSLDDATKLSCNLTQFNDVELAGLRYMLSKNDLARLKQFKAQREYWSNQAK